MRVAIYTSCSVNYLAKARVLGSSLRTSEVDCDLHVLLNDQAPVWLDVAAEPFHRIVTPDELGYESLPLVLFEHTVMEMNTAVKGRYLKRLLESDYDLVLYLDPDCLALGDVIGEVERHLGTDDVGVIPHIYAPVRGESGIRFTERSVMKHGLYNLGFLAVRNTANGRAFASWWADRLDRFCFARFDEGMFTDQKIVDLAPLVCDGVRVMRAPGIDLASWNVDTRTVKNTPNGLMVDGEPLVVYHFSGVGPKSVHEMMRHKMFSGAPEVAVLAAQYEELIADAGEHGLRQTPYAFNYYADGRHIPEKHRRNQDRLKLADPFTESPGLQVPDEDYLLRAINDVATSGLFDTSYYMQTANLAPGNFGSEIRQLDPIGHYVRVGCHFGCQPCPYFEDRGLEPIRTGFVSEFHRYVCVEELGPLPYITPASAILVQGSTPTDRRREFAELIRGRS